MVRSEYKSFRLLSSSLEEWTKEVTRRHGLIKNLNVSSGMLTFNDDRPDKKWSITSRM